MLQNWRRIFITIIIVLLVVAPVSMVFAQSEIKALPTPENFYIDLVNNDDVVLLWDEIQDPSVEGFIILRSEVVDKKPEEIGRAQSHESSYTDTTVLPGKTYTYQVKSFGSGYLTGDSEIKSVVLQENGKFSSPFPTSTDTDKSISSIEAKLLEEKGSKFWMNLIAVNALLLGIILLIYMTLRYFFAEKSPRFSDPILQFKINRKNKINLKLKSDHDHQDVVSKAKDKFYSNRKHKMSEWLQADKVAEIGEKAEKESGTKENLNSKPSKN